MVLGVGEVAGPARLPGAQQPAVGVAQLAQEEPRRPPGGRQPVGPVEDGRRLGQRRHEEGVPGQQHLVVEAGPHPLVAGGQQEGTGPLDRGRPGCGPLGDVQDRAALEVPALGDAVVAGDHGGVVGSEDGGELGGRPHVEAALDALGVGVLGRGEPARRLGQVREDVADRLLDHEPVALLAEEHVGVEVGPGQQRLVVEHLLEVGDQPHPVGRVAVEAAAQLVVQPAARHGVEGGADDLLGLGRGVAGVGAEQAVQRPSRAGTWAPARSRPTPGRRSRGRRGRPSAGPRRSAARTTAGWPTTGRWPRSASPPARSPRRGAGARRRRRPRTARRTTAGRGGARRGSRCRRRRGGRRDRRMR